MNRCRSYSPSCAMDHCQGAAGHIGVHWVTYGDGGDEQRWWANKSPYSEPPKPGTMVLPGYVAYGMPWLGLGRLARNEVVLFREPPFSFFTEEQVREMAARMASLADPSSDPS